MVAVAGDVIATALRLYGIIDQTEQPTPVDLANNALVLNDLLRSEHVDGAAQYLITRIAATIPAGVAGQISSFNLGVSDPKYLVQVDAVAVKSIWCGDISQNVNRETRMGPTADVVRTTSLGIITKWHQERQVDGSVRVTVWQPPRVATPVLIEYGGRISPIAAGTDPVALPPEGLHDAALLLGRRVFGSYGRSAQAVAAILADSEAVNKRWRDWARGQQWLRMVRS
jgi:hypothetical protein